MTYTVASIVEEIRVVLDQNMSSTELSELGDVDTLSLDDLIKSKIEDAAQQVILSAPYTLLSDIGTSLTGSPTIGVSPFRANLTLPDDFLRLLCFKFTGWDYPLYEALPPSSPLYLQAHSKYNVCGTKDRPLVFLCPGSSSKVLEVFCASSTSDTLDGCQYVKKPAITTVSSTDQIDLGKRLKRPTVYYAAYLVALAIREADVAEKLLLVCKDMLHE